MTCYIVVTASYMVLVAIKLPFLARATGTGTGVAWVQLCVYFRYSYGHTRSTATGV